MTKKRYFTESVQDVPTQSQMDLEMNKIDPSAIKIEPSDFEEFSQSIQSITSVSDSTLSQLYDRFKHKDDKILLALDHHLKTSRDETMVENTLINSRLDNSRANAYKEVHKVIPPISLENNPKRKRTRGKQIPFVYAKRSSSNLEVPEIIDTQWRRYVGTLFTDAFATRPYLRPLEYGTPMIVKSLKPKKLTGKDKRSQESAIIRLYLGSGSDERELGKIREDLTRIFAPLLDFDLVTLDTSIVVETKNRLSTGDSFYVKIDVYFTQLAFKSKKIELKNELTMFKKPDIKTRFNFGAETEQESNLRLRQFAITRLFQRLVIRPIKFKNNQEMVATQYETDIDIDIEEADETNETEADNELDLDQLKSFYSDNQQSEMLKALPTSTKPPIENFAMDLRPYQKHGLSWLLAREKEYEILGKLTNNGDDLNTLSSQDLSDLKQMDEGVMNPLWSTFKWSKTEDSKEKYFYGNMHSGELSLTKPLIKSSVNGGILSDEMGLGKTISALALINSVPYDPQGNDGDTSYAHQTTLVIVPMSLLSQWEKEFKRANNNSNHRCIIYYGSQSLVDLSAKLTNKKKHIPIMLVTTYGTVLSEFTKIERRRDDLGNLPKTGLFSVKFFRIIVDEGHNIRNRTSKTSRAIFELKSSRKWVLTGTPVVNRLDDIYSLVKFLELEPWNNFSYWKTFITLPFESKKIKETLDVVKTILEPIFLRRTKDMKDSQGNPLVTLPPKEVIIEEVKFNEQELHLYNWFKEKASRSFRESLKTGDVLRRYTQILTHILRLRQICCHRDLVGHLVNDMEEEVENGKDEELELFLKELNDEDADKFANETEVNEVKYSLYEPLNKVINDSECAICTTSPIGRNEMIITPCGHCYCIKCLFEHIDYQGESRDDIKEDTTTREESTEGSTEVNNENIKIRLNTVKCPNCRNPISKYKLFKIRNKPTTKNEFKFHTKKEIPEDFDFQLYLYDPSKSSSKVQALKNHINSLMDQNQLQPIIVFSQFSSFLDIIENELILQIGDQHIKCLKFDGRLRLNEREKLLEDFNNYQKDPTKLTILLLSLKAGGVGLNLTNASTAFMMDPWWSPSVEEQAIDRLHRIGQERNVKVVRFIMKNTIEIKMLKIQERKKQIGDIVGLEEEEKRKRRIEEIQILFEE